MRAILRTITISAALLAGPAAAQDARTVVTASTKAMGLEGVDSIRFYGSGTNYNLGQNNNANGPWPATPLNDYARWIDFTQPASRATAVTFAVPVQGGAAVQGVFNQSITPANATWLQQAEIWLTPWGFLKGAAQNNATLASRTIDGKAFRVITWSPALKSASGASYRVVGYIGPQDLVERVETWVENPIFGDLQVTADYTNYRDAMV